MAGYLGKDQGGGILFCLYAYYVYPDINIDNKPENSILDE